MDLILGKQRVKYQCFLLIKRLKQVTMKIKKIMKKPNISSVQRT